MCVKETIRNEAKNKKSEFLSISLGKLGNIFLGHLLATKGVIQASEETITKGHGL